MSQYGAPEQSQSPAPGGMGYGQPPQQSQYGAPQDPYAQQQQQQKQQQPGQWGQEQGGQFGQQNETFAPQGQHAGAEQGQQGQEQQGQMGMNGQMVQQDGQGGQQRPGAGALQATAKPGPAASHSHSRFHQDAHHHHNMKAYHKMAKQGITPEHIHSLVHIGSLGLAMLAHNSGMTAGHEDEEETKAQ